MSCSPSCGFIADELAVKLMLHEAIFCATCLTMPLQNELHEPLQHVTPRAMAKKLRDKLQTSLPKVKSCSTFRNDFSYKIQVAGAIVLCNTLSATCLAMALQDKLHKKLPRVTSALGCGINIAEVMGLESPFLGCSLTIFA